MLSDAELEKVIDKVIASNKSLVEEKGTSASGPLVGLVMKEVRGKANATSVSEFVKKKLSQLEKK